MTFHAALWDGKGLGYLAQDDRQLIDVAVGGVGIIDIGDLLVSAGSGFNSSIAAGRATIRNSFATTQGGLYIVRNDAPVAKQHQTPNPSNARVDQVFVKVYDSETGGDASDIADGVVIQGTASGSVSGTAATALDARTGVGTPPSNNYILAADVYVPAAAASAAAFTYRDRRPLATITTPIVKTAISAISFQPFLPIAVGQGGPSGAGFTNYQFACAMYLPRRVAGATKIRWAYIQQGTPLTGNYNIGIGDASGRLIVSTGSVALTGGAGSIQARSETITTTTFEAGIYYVVVGYASLGAGSIQMQALGWNLDPIALPNMFLYNTTGGVTLPTTILGFTDLNGQAISAWMVPSVALSTT